MRCTSILLVLNAALFAEQGPEQVFNLVAKGHQLASAYQLTTAEAAYRKALTASNEVYGSQSKQSAVILGSLGRTLASQGRSEEAEAMMFRSAKLLEALTGEYEIELLRVRTTLAHMYTLRGDSAAALPISRRVLAIAQRMYPEDKDFLAIAHQEVVDALLADVQFRAAQPYSTQAVSLLEQIRPADDLDLLNARASAARIRFHTGARKEGLTQIAALIRSAPNTTPVLLATLYLYQAEMRSKTGSFEAAAQSLTNAASIHRATLGPSHPATLATLRSSALVLRKAHRPAEARALESEIKSFSAR